MTPSQSSPRPTGKRDRPGGPPPARPTGSVTGRAAARRGRWRAAVAVAVLAVALTVALWPRGGADPQGADADPALVAARAAAALEPCPVPAPGAPAAGGRLAGLRLPCLGSPGSIDIGAVAADQPVLLNVWASWCVPCREEIPALQEYTALPGAIEVLGVSAEADPVAGLELMRSLGGTYPSVVDADVRLRRELAGPPILPANYVLLPGGAIVRIDPPVVFANGEQVRDVLAGYLP